jgi:CBS domain-containing protein
MVPFLNLKVSDVMTSAVVTVEPHVSLAEVRALFETHKYNALPVVAEGDRIVGMMTLFDFLRAFLFSPSAIMPNYDRILSQPVEDYMTRNPETVQSALPLSRVLTRMIETRNKSFPVVEDGRLQGIIAREDILRGLRRDLEER